MRNVGEAPFPNELRKVLLLDLLVWQRAVELAWQRTDVASFDARDQRVHLVNLVIATRNVLRISEVARDIPGVRAALDAFNRRVPRVKDVRDVLEHFDEYRRGKGRLQRASPFELSIDVVHRGTDVGLRLGGGLEIVANDLFEAVLELAVAVCDELRPGQPIAHRPRP